MRSNWRLFLEGENVETLSSHIEYISDAGLFSGVDLPEHLSWWAVRRSTLADKIWKHCLHCAFLSPCMVKACHTSFLGRPPLNIVLISEVLNWCMTLCVFKGYGSLLLINHWPTVRITYPHKLFAWMIKGIAFHGSDSPIHIPNNQKHSHEWELPILINCLFGWLRDCLSLSDLI